MRNPHLRLLVPVLALAGLLWSPAHAAEHEILMLNRGEAGIMVFEPAYLEIAPGDTVHFRAADRGHNAASIDAMSRPAARALPASSTRTSRSPSRPKGSTACAACPTTR